MYWYAAHDQRARWAQRHLRERLRDLGIANLSLKRYRAAIDSFLGWQFVFFGGLAAMLEQLDDHLSAYLEYFWESGRG